MKNTNKKDHKQNKRGVEKPLLYFLELIVTPCKNMYYHKLSQFELKLSLGQGLRKILRTEELVLFLAGVCIKWYARKEEMDGRR